MFSRQPIQVTNGLTPKLTCGPFGMANLRSQDRRVKRLIEPLKIHSAFASD